MKDLIKQLETSHKIIKIICSNKKIKSLPYQKVIWQPILLKDELIYQGSFYTKEKVFHKNLSQEEAMKKILSLAEFEYKQINILTTEEDIQILTNKWDKPKISRKPAKRTEASLSHNREKKYPIPVGVPCDFIIALGVMEKDGKVVPKHYSKFRQINRFLEIVEDSLDALPNGSLSIIDFGCGKSYLTFALYYFLKEKKGRQVNILGLDLKEDVIAFCNQTASKLNYFGLRFQLGDIATYDNHHADMVVTLHACDTATDYALINAVKWETKVILSVPCCQHELFHQITNTTLDPILTHGIMKDKFTEILTNGLRGLKLESKGYDVSMVEFTSLEHTAKNVMIKATYTGNPKKSALKEYNALKETYQVTPTIDLL